VSTATCELAADVIVVGSGSAGAVVARRLADAGAQVLLLESGGADTAPELHDASEFFRLWETAAATHHVTEPQGQLGGRRLEWTFGHVLGGSSSINGMAWVRGAPADYDHWGYLGNTGWSYEDVLAHYRRIEDFDRGPSDVHGAGGPIHIASDWEPSPIHVAVVAAAAEQGIPFNDDMNGRDPYGAAHLQYNIRAGRRQSTSTTYLAGAGPRLEILTGAHARRLRFDGTRCVGVEWERGGHLERAGASSEVVLSAGVVGSPKLLLLSGIGPARELAELGIAVVAELPGVGRNLHDHVHVPLVYTTERPIEQSPDGVPSMQTYITWRTDARLVAPDIQTAVFAEPVYRDGMYGPPQGVTLAVTLVRPASRGRLRLRSADPAAAPSLDPATYECADDLRVMCAAVRWGRAVGATAALREWGARELYPGPDVEDDRALVAYVRDRTWTAFHQVGTCRMGIDAGAVVDPQLRVRGVDGLRVADASIMPAVTSGNTNAPSVMIGEAAAALIARRG
jgi:choline dehydrogenase